MISLTRRYRFSSSHRLHSTALTDAENDETYGKCNHPYGHGHDYVLDVTVAGPLDPATGRIVDLTDLDRLVQQNVLEHFDHRDLNTEVPEFAALVPTSENVAIVIERRLQKSWDNNISGAVLENVHLHETRRNRFALRP